MGMGGAHIHYRTGWFWPVIWWKSRLFRARQQLWEKPCVLIEASTFPELICYVTGGSWQQRMSIGWQGPAFWYLLILHGFLPRLIYNLKNNPDYIILTIVMNFTEWVVSLQRKSLICEVFCNQENLFDRCIWRNGRRAGRDMRSIVLMKIRSHLLWNIWRRSRGLTLLAYVEGSEAAADYDEECRKMALKIGLWE